MGPQRVTTLMLLLVLGVTPAAGQTLYGRVTDAVSGEPVALAALTIVAESRRDSTTVLSDSLGGYAVRVLGAGRYVLRASRIGYETASTSPFELLGSELTLMDIKLAPIGVELDPIQVVGRSGFEPARIAFNRRCELGKGVCLDLGDIALRHPRNVLDALRGVDGVSADWQGSQGYKLYSFNGECLMLFLNNSIYPAMRTAGRQRRVGVMSGPVSPALSIELDVLDPSQLYGVEIYQNYRDVPLELRESMLGFALWPPGYTRPCGAIIMWTRAAW